MMQYMVTYKNGFNGGCEYFKTHTEAVTKALESRKYGHIPEAVWKYNPTTDRFEIVGKFTVKAKEV